MYHIQLGKDEESRHDMQEKELLLVSALSKGGFSMHTNPVIMIARC